jgi:peptide/nickel transport system ATP-binding protein
MGSIIVPEKCVRDVKLTAIAGVPPNLKKPPAGCRFAERCKFARTECWAMSVPLRDTGDGRAYRCLLPEKELREAYSQEAYQHVR